MAKKGSEEKKSKHSKDYFWVFEQTVGIFCNRVIIDDMVRAVKKRHQKDSDPSASVKSGNTLERRGFGFRCEIFLAAHGTKNPLHYFYVR